MNCPNNFIAAGFYKFFVNGKDITKGELAPYISNPDELVYYDRYDVSECLKDAKTLSLSCLVTVFRIIRAGLYGTSKKLRGAAYLNSLCD